MTFSVEDKVKLDYGKTRENSGQNDHKVPCMPKWVRKVGRREFHFKCSDLRGMGLMNRMMEKKIAKCEFGFENQKELS